MRMGEFILLGCLLLACVFSPASVALAADPTEQIAFDAALRDFDIQLWAKAEKSFADFITRHPQSTNVLEATQRRDFARGEVLLGNHDYAEAASTFANFQKSYPTVVRSALAGVREAFARLQAGDPVGAERVLDNPTSPFVRALAAGGPPEILFRGLVTKSQAWLAIGDSAKAIATLDSAKAWSLLPANEFARLQALALAREKAGDMAAAAAAQEAVEVAAREPSLAPQRPASIAFVAELLSRMGKLESAAEWYQKNLTVGAPPTYQRQAALELARQRLATNDLAGTRQRLETFLSTATMEPENQPLRLLLAQVLFRQYEAIRERPNSADSIALLNLAIAQYQQILTNSPIPEIAGPALLGRGWCLWADGTSRGVTNRFIEAETNFVAATQFLPQGLEKSRAQLKAGDCQLARGDAAKALATYRLVAEETSALPPDAANSSLIESAWRQVGIAASQTKDRTSAMLASEKLLALDPRSEAAARTTLLAGQLISRLGDADEARGILSRFLSKSPDSPFRPMVELAIAGSDLRAQQWTNAIRELDLWIVNNPQHPDLPRAVWDRAWAKAQARMLTNAAAEFASLAAQFPTAPSAGLAQLWLADDYFSRREYDRAGLTCNLLLTNEVWRGKPEWYRAKFLSAVSARKLENWRDAGVLLIELLNDKETPASLLPATYFALGEYHLSRPVEPDKPPDSAIDNAIDTFRKVTTYTNSPLRASALGLLANCYLQKAAHATNFLRPALELYQQVVDLPAVDPSVRGTAAFGFAQTSELWAIRLAAAGSVIEARDTRNAAATQLLDMLHGKWLRPGEALDLSLVEKSGRLAGELLEEMGQWDSAASLYRWLAGELPVQKSAWESKAAVAARHPGG